MTFFNENWFWTGIFTLAGSLGTVLITQLFSGRTQVRLERLRAHESDLLRAYRQLYSFISDAEVSLFQPSEPRRDFIELMKHNYFKSIKPDMLLYPKEMRSILQKFESQYDCLTEPDLIPECTLDDFIRKQVFHLLPKLSELIETRVAKMLHEG